jgi:hypothetical protein
LIVDLGLAAFRGMGILRMNVRSLYFQWKTDDFAKGARTKKGTHRIFISENQLILFVLN